jgi:hypothetical protein
MPADHLRRPDCAEAVSVTTSQAPAHLPARTTVPNATSNRGTANATPMRMTNGMFSTTELRTQQNRRMQRPVTSTSHELHHFACRCDKFREISQPESYHGGIPRNKRHTQYECAATTFPVKELHIAACTRLLRSLQATAVVARLGKPWAYYGAPMFLLACSWLR